MAEPGERESVGEKQLYDAIESLLNSELEMTDAGGGFLSFYAPGHTVQPIYESLVRSSLHDLLIPPGTEISQVFIRCPNPRLATMWIKLDPDWAAVKYKPSVVTPAFFVTLGYDYRFPLSGDPCHETYVLQSIGVELSCDRTLTAGRETSIQTEMGFLAPSVGDVTRLSYGTDSDAVLKVAAELVE